MPVLNFILCCLLFVSFFSLAQTSGSEELKPLELSTQEEKGTEAAALEELLQEDETEDWLPPEDNWDWLKTKSGEWIKGDIIAMYSELIEFDSAEFGLVKVDWADMAILRSGGPQSLLFTDKSIIKGLIFVDDVTVSFVVSGEKRPRGTVIAMAPYVKEEYNNWDARISVSADTRSGNSEQDSFDLALKATRRSSTSLFRAQFSTTYARSKEEVTDDVQRLTSSWDWFFAQKVFFSPLNYEFNRERFKNIAHRHTYSAQLGYKIYDEKAYSWNASLGPGYQFTQYKEVEGDNNEYEYSGVLEVFTDMEWDVSKDIAFDFVYNLKVVNESAGKMYHHFETGFDIDLIGKLDLVLRYILDRIEEPKPDDSGMRPEKNDSRILVGLEYEF